MKSFGVRQHVLRGLKNGPDTSYSDVVPFMEMLVKNFSNRVCGVLIGLTLI